MIGTTREDFWTLIDEMVSLDCYVTIQRADEGWLCMFFDTKSPQIMGAAIEKTLPLAAKSAALKALRIEAR